MKTILVPTEQNAAMASALDAALLLAKNFASCIEGFPLRPAVADMVAMDPDAGMTMVAVKENDADMVRQAEDLFRSFMERHGVSRNWPTTHRPVCRCPGDGMPRRRAATTLSAATAACSISSCWRGPGEEWQSPSMVTLESALFESGRPVLIAPPKSPRSIATNMLIAWNR